MSEMETLKEAVVNLYYAAHWTPDREVDAKALWEAVRDAAGLTHGFAPNPRAAAPTDAEIERAAKALVDKIDVVIQDPQYSGVWVLAKVHGCEYTGPDFGAELKRARAALNAARSP